MFDRSGVSLLPEVVILAGVVLLVTSVYHSLLVWFAAGALVIGVLLLLTAYLQYRFWREPSTGFPMPPANEPNKEG